MRSQSELQLALVQWSETLMRGSMRRLYRAAQIGGLPVSQLGPLLHIRRRGALAVSDIGTRMGVSNAAASQMLDRLVAQGLVVRSEDPNDRRVRQIALTPEGLRRVDETLRSQTDWLEGLADLLSPKEQASVITVLKLLIEKANLLEQEDGAARCP
jgi:DNA-binding MarR family transcriptional regulator